MYNDLVPDEVVERINSSHRRQEPATEEEFWEIMREGRRHRCDRYYEDKWDKEDEGRDLRSPKTSA